MATLYTQADSNIRKTWFYVTFFLCFIIIVGFILSYALGTYIYLIIAGIYAFFSSFFSYWFSDKIVLAMSHAKEIEKRDNPELYRIVENLAITAGIPLPKIYIINQEQPNAFATGRNQKHAVIAVTKGLLDRLERAELEGVIAHEMAHIGNKDILLQTMVVVFVAVIVVLTDFFFRISFWGGLSSRRNNNSDSKAGIIIMLIAFALAILAPIFATIIKLAISRKREYLADASGALLTRYPEGLANALEKISSDSNTLRTANNSTAHLYIASPFKGKQSKSWLTKLFSTHPPIEERISLLRGMRL
ncbi:MAG: M48 family metallopeptidase [Candidatus Nealsonbacteria bacterium]